MGLAALHQLLKCGAWRKRYLRGRSPDSQVITKPAAFPFLAEQWLTTPARSLLTVAQPCGNLTRFPFHSPL